MRARWPLMLVGAFTVVGFLLRLHQYGGSLFGDEMSTIWIVQNHGFFETVSVVSSDAEISPPLYFLLAWITTQIGSAPELVRLPALIAGTVSIPMLYLLGLRTVGRIPGIIGAGIMAISPFMIFFSASGRAYTLMLVLLVGSTLSMLAATRTGRTRWWFAYALLSCLALYSHYTALFYLFAQFIWLLWAEPAMRKPGLIANAGAALLFLPWLPSFFSDSNSPTTELLEFLQGDGFEVKRLALEQWAFGHPLIDPSQLPGRTMVVTIVLALVIATLIGAFRTLPRTVVLGSWLRANRLAVLIFVIALATPLAEALLSLLGTDLFGSRNLLASTPGFLLVIGTVLTAAGPTWGGICGLAVIGGFMVGTVKSLEASSATPDYKAAASKINGSREANDSVVDLVTPPVTPVPSTPLDEYVDDDLPVYPLNLPSGEPPFLPVTPVPDPDLNLNRALSVGRKGHVFIVGPEMEVTVGESKKGTFSGGNIELPSGWRIDSAESWPGVAELDLYVVSRNPTE